MHMKGAPRRSIWLDDATGLPAIIDQTELPYHFVTRTLADLEAAAEAIEAMRVRGAPLIGATAAHGLAVAMAADPSDEGLASAAARLRATRPTAVNLFWAIDRVVRAVEGLPADAREGRARDEAIAICDEDVDICSRIGTHGLSLFEELRAERVARGRPVDGEHPLELLTHCNAGWLATVDWGTALSPIYKAHEAGWPIHIWVDETRPRNQGASLTALELREMGVPHTVVVDNAGGHLMQRGRVDAVIVGSDRTTAAGDVCNKIGTYLKALAARDNDVPFYAALPVSTIDWGIEDGLADIPIEERSEDEVRQMSGRGTSGRVETVALFPQESPVANPAFDVTPARLVTALVTEHGAFPPEREALARLRRISEAGPEAGPEA